MPKFQPLYGVIELAIRKLASTDKLSKSEIIDHIFEHNRSAIDELNPILVREALNIAINDVFKHKNRAIHPSNQTTMFDLFPGVPIFEQVPASLAAEYGAPEIQRPEDMEIGLLRRIVYEDNKKPRKQSRKIQSYRRIIAIADARELDDRQTVRNAIATV